MSTLLVWREKLQQTYARFGFVIRRVFQFLLGLAVFGLISLNVGFMETASSLFVTLGLALLCAFLPLTVMTFLAAALVLVHFYALSLSVTVVAALIFVVMYIFYFRFSPHYAWVVLLTPVAFALKIPYVIPVAMGLVGSPICAVPVVLGTVTYYMVHYVGTASETLGSKGGDMINGLSSFASEVLRNPDMLVTALAFAVCVILVYNLRIRSFNHAWKAAIGAGVVVNVALVLAGRVLFDYPADYVSLAAGSVAAILIGLVLEFLFFSVNYAGARTVQFDDDEYYYYVKVVPKLTVAAPKKTVKHIHEKQETEEGPKEEHPGDTPRKAAAAGLHSQDRTEEALLKSSLQRELGMEAEEE